MKTMLASLLLWLALTSCASLTSTPLATLGSTDNAVSTPTPKPYWDLLPLVFEPVGGWKTHRMEKLNLAFQYPSIYDEVECGSIFFEDKVVGENEYTLVGFAGGSIRIRIFSMWDTQLDEYVSEGKTSSEVQLLTAVEQFSIDGLPARRHISRVPGSSALEYIKVASVVFEGRLYMFQYNAMVDLSGCDAPPLSEEAVFEHLLSTLDFIP